MQKLGERMRTADTPADIQENLSPTGDRTHVRSSVALCRSETGNRTINRPALNSREGSDGAVGSTTSLNNSDAALTPKGGRNSRVSVTVLNQRGSPLMPCSPRKARILLVAGKATVQTRTPFVIRLTAATGETTQAITLGADSGYLHIGLSAVSDKEEVYSVDVTLRKDIVKLNSERAAYRRNRRGRKTWYRPARFDNRTKPAGWLAPSIQHKLDSNVKVIEGVAKMFPITEIIIEVAAFDIQKIKAAAEGKTISGTDYQNGEQAGFWNVREYVLYRDGHKCAHCHGKSKDKRLHVHHIKSRQTGGDSPANLVTLCHICHGKHHNGEVKLKLTKPDNGFKAATFMSMVRWKLIDQLQEKGFNVKAAYGYQTKSKRITLGLEKSHLNDAFVIADGTTQPRTGTSYTVRQVRKCNRKLFRGPRSHIRNTALREVFGFRQWDKVNYQGRVLFVKGRRLRGDFALCGIDGELVCEASYKKLTLLERATTLLVKRTMRFLPDLKDGVPTAQG